MNSTFEVASQVKPERALACSFNLEYLQLGGWDIRKGYDRPFMWYDWLFAGWCGENGEDGVSEAPPIFGGDVTIQPTEGQERINPVIIHEYPLVTDSAVTDSAVTDSAGPGKWRGGLDTRKTVTVYAGKRTMMSYMCDRGRCTPWGI